MIKRDNDPSTILCHNVYMIDEYSFTLRRIDQTRGDLDAIADEVEFLRAQLAQMPTRMDMARLVLRATLTTSALVLAGIEALFR